MSTFLFLTSFITQLVTAKKKILKNYGKYTESYKVHCGSGNYSKFRKSGSKSVPMQISERNVPFKMKIKNLQNMYNNVKRRKLIILRSNKRMRLRPAPDPPTGCNPKTKTFKKD